MRVLENLLLAALIVAGVAMLCAGLNPHGGFLLLTIGGSVLLGSALIALAIRNSRQKE